MDLGDGKIRGTYLRRASFQLNGHEVNPYQYLLVLLDTACATLIFIISTSLAFAPCALHCLLFHFTGSGCRLQLENSLRPENEEYHQKPCTRGAQFPSETETALSDI
jgi:hypothetical protein